MTRAMRLSPLDPLMFVMETYTAFAQFYAGRHDAARLLAERASQEQPNFLAALRAAAASTAAAGRLDEARRYIARALQLDPELRISNLKDRMPSLQSEDFAKYVEALRMAGLPD